MFEDFVSGMDGFNNILQLGGISEQNIKNIKKVKVNDFIRTLKELGKYTYDKITVALKQYSGKTMYDMCSDMLDPKKNKLYTTTEP
jgi:hypothetical protein